VKPDSSLRPFFEELFEILCQNMKKAQDPFNLRYWEAKNDVTDIVEKASSKTIADRAKEAIALGMDVWIGNLSSDSEDIESFFCCESFEIDQPGLYVNAIPCAW
jgi:hypothetical protein